MIKLLNIILFCLSFKNLLGQDRLIDSSGKIIVNCVVIDSCNQFNRIQSNSDSLVISISEDRSFYKLKFSNTERDTLFLFGTYFLDSYLFNSLRFFYFDDRAKTLELDFSEHSLNHMAYFSGFKRYQFVKICPYTQIEINIPRALIMHQLPKHLNAVEGNIKFRYYKADDFERVSKINGENNRFLLVSKCAPHKIQCKMQFAFY